MKVVTKMNREHSEEVLIRELVRKAERLAREAKDLRDFIINFKEWKEQSSEEIQEETT